jgi:4-amino-4-deoxy-L-arabinose transferase-like glycosyltransferase
MDYVPCPTGFERIAASIPGAFTRTRLYVALAISALSFCLIINSSWNATPDSALYLSLGESLASGTGYVFNGEPHTFVPPGFPALIAGTAWLLGPNFLSYRLLMALTGLLTAWIGYLFVSRLCGRDTALLVGGVFAVNYALLSNCTLILSDVPFACFTLVALHAVLSAARTRCITTWAVIAGLAVGVLPVIRINGLGIPPVAAFFLFCAWKNFAWHKRVLCVGLFVLMAFLPAIMWQWWKASFPVSVAEGTYFGAVAARRISDQAHVIITTFWGYFAETSETLTGVTLKTGFLEFIAPLIMLVGMVEAFRSGDRLLVPLTVVQFCGLLLSSPGGRYLIFLIPALYLFLALGILKLAPLFTKDHVTPRQSGRVLVTCFVILAVLNVGHNAITIAKARTALEPRGAESERSVPFFTASRWLKANAPHATVLTTRSRIIHYLSGCPTVTLLRSGVPDHEIWVQQTDQIEKLMRERNPEFLFTDSSRADLYAQVTKALTELGMRVDPIPEATSSPRYRLFRIVRPEHPC